MKLNVLFLDSRSIFKHIRKDGYEEAVEENVGEQSNHHTAEDEKRTRPPFEAKRLGCRHLDSRLECGKTGQLLMLGKLCSTSSQDFAMVEGGKSNPAIGEDMQRIHDVDCKY